MMAARPAIAGNESRFRAYPDTGGTFEVIAAFSENAIYWCGAATYARTALAPAGTQRIYVVQGLAPSTAEPGKVSVRFSLDPPDKAAPSMLTTDVSRVGNRMSLTQALQTCNERSPSG